MSDLLTLALWCLAFALMATTLVSVAALASEPDDADDVWDWWQDVGGEG